MTKRKGQKDKQHNGQNKRLVLLSLFFGHFVACPSVPVLLAIVLLILLSLFFGHCVACPSGPKEKEKRTSSTMAKRKRTEGQATQ
jgi:hypothetical protein